MFFTFTWVTNRCFDSVQFLPDICHLEEDKNEQSHRAEGIGDFDKSSNIV